MLDTGDEILYLHAKLVGMESPAEKCFLTELMTPATWDPMRRVIGFFVSTPRHTAGFLCSTQQTKENGITETFTMAALWFSLTVVATILANHLKVSMSLTEICVGVAAGFVADRFFGPYVLGANVDWLKCPNPPGSAPRI